MTVGWSFRSEAPGRVTNVTATLPVSIRLRNGAVAPTVLWTWAGDPQGFNPGELTGEAAREVLFQAAVRMAWAF